MPQAVAPAPADFVFGCGVQGWLMTNDFAVEAPRTMLVIGDSISTTTILGGTPAGRDFWHAQAARALAATGRRYRRVVKGDGG